ncbi:hypothetical protein [Thaumasiovibrio sp. DFM-14]|uniref:hypothetical protein n=1 Tax=Thaumasiovibrio sp. DFM-14 TaxID=3384792 RepID=UPI0039A2B9AF
MTLNTSHKQVPAGAKIIRDLTGITRNGIRLLNFGCEKWPELTEQYLKETLPGSTVQNYDPNSKAPGVITNEALLSEYWFDVTLCLNVLNVIEDIEPVIRLLATLNTQYMIIQIYEGDKSGVGRATRDGYQRNEKAARYEDALTMHFGSEQVRRRGMYFVIKNKETLKDTQ